MTSLLSRYLVSLPQPHLSPCGFAHLFGFVCARSRVMHLIWSDCLSIVGSSWASRRFSFCSVVFIAAPISCLLAPCPYIQFWVARLRPSQFAPTASQFAYLNSIRCLLSSALNWVVLFASVHGASSRMHSGRSSHFGIQSGQPRIAFHIAPFTLTLLFEKGVSALASPSSGCNRAFIIM